MKKYAALALICMVVVALASDFTDVDVTKYKGKSNKSLTVALGNNFDLLTVGKRPVETWTQSTGDPTNTPAAAVVLIQAPLIITQHLENAVSGQIVRFQNIAGTNVIFSNSDANIDLGSSDITLGDTDNLVLMGVGTTWYKLSTANN